MKTKMVDGIKVMTLTQTHGSERVRGGEAATMLRLWSLLLGDAGLRDMTVGHRNLR